MNSLLGRGKGFFGITVWAALGTVLVALITLSAPLYAQTGYGPVRARRKHSASADANNPDPGGSAAKPSYGSRPRPVVTGPEAGAPGPSGSTVNPVAAESSTETAPPSSSSSTSVSEPPAAASQFDSSLALTGDPFTGREGFRKPRRPDFNENIYYQNKLEFSVQTGFLPVNVPFPFDFLLGGGYVMTPLKYTLVPTMISLRWQLDNLAGPPVLRGNWDADFSANYTDIPRGPETRAFYYMMGIRRNFVPRNWRVAPYLEGRVGTGTINAKEPYGVEWAQGQDFTFTLGLGAGLRFNINSKYAFEAGAGYMHISNLYLSEPRYSNYGINVYGPMFGFDFRLGKPRQRPEK
jgi:hypothetical protein